ncbi:Indoleamine 2 3-dioxygenase [Apiospora arundinis]|uniref:Indoleamine 2,3-dioxygenase n=1 Tax=Apiospora arundinis TaxID=335852 RepID=A0ABR2JMX4_9PEZI
MSPHALSPFPGKAVDETAAYLSSKFAVTSNGFLPKEAPLKELPSYYASWDALIRRMPQLLRTGALREKARELELLSTDELKTEAQWRRAYVILGFLAQAYIWGSCQPAEALPAAISVPFLRVAEHLELPPVLTYAASNLWNFTCAGAGDFTDVDAVKSMHTFTGTEDESWFFMISVAMEAQAGRAIPAMVAALETATKQKTPRDYEALARALDDLAVSIGKVGGLLERMYEHCEPDVFYHQIRPFLAGSKNMEAAGLPRGVLYPEQQDKDGKWTGSWHQWRGGSNGQSSMIQFFDVVLGVEHTNEGNSRASPPPTPVLGASTKGQPQAAPPRSYHEEVRDYMPGPHRRFLVHVSQQGSLREMAQKLQQQPGGPSDDAQARFCASYVQATEALGRLRNKHIQIVTRYIILPAQRAARELMTMTTTESNDQETKVPKKQNLATSSAVKSSQSHNGGGVAAEEPELRGTGGTTLIPFLKQSRDETFEAGDLGN